MTVSVAKKLIPGRSGLSDIAALALAFIDGGVEWLAWAVADPAAMYAFPDETTLINQAQLGLHASPVALLPGLGLLVSPVKLMTFSLGDLRTVAKAEGGAQDPATQAQTRTILSAHKLLTQADFAAVPAFLSSLGVANAPLFQCLGMNEMIALSELINLPQPQDGEPNIQSDAASFALNQARIPEEFADYYRAYMALTTKLQTAQKPADQRLAQANAAVETLLPLMFAALDCPQVEGLVPPFEVANAVKDWLRKGRRVGFSRLSEGVCRIIDSTTFTTETGAAAQQMINLYLANAQAFLTANYPQTGRISQDGRSCLLPTQSGDLSAELLLGSGGDITLRHFRRTPPATP
ncbi:MAG: hypothetical protein H7Y60_00815 [Rhodospirillaceae bacterium]|nr:hypothetical protein [Rhodospirillales bacterium]